MLFSEFRNYFREIERNELYKYRLTFQGGRSFIDEYCHKFSNRESDSDFAFRRKVTYNPAFASGAVYEVANSIFKRADDIERIGGPSNYQKAVTGEGNGVDLLGRDMNTFMCDTVLKELLVAAQVGIYTDKAPIPENATLADSLALRPYVYIYQAEDILAYEYDEGPNRHEFKMVMLRERIPRYDNVFGIKNGFNIEYKLYQLVDGGVKVTPIRETSSEAVDPEMEISPPIFLNLPRIPFHLVELPKSLLCDIADAQIALLNLSSSDLWYSLKSNYPFYVEPFDPRSEASNMMKPESTAQPRANSNSIAVGPTTGRRYPMGTNQPAFISPSTDPLLASMKKQDQIKAEIREMVHLALASLTSSADSKAADKDKLEDGLAYIATILQFAERRVAQDWAMYEATEPAVIKYPKKYYLISETDDRENTKLDLELASKTTSPTFKKELLKKIAKRRVGSTCNSTQLSKITKEIETTDVTLADWQEVAKDIENGLVSLETASKARGYPSGEVAEAAEDHAERLRRIALNQSDPNKIINDNINDPGARGLKDLSADPKSGQEEKKESRDTTTQDTPTDNTRGPGIG
jgi:hypothetical protein